MLLLFYKKDKGKPIHAVSTVDAFYMKAGQSYWENGI